MWCSRSLTTPKTLERFLTLTGISACIALVFEYERDDVCAMKLLEKVRERGKGRGGARRKVGILKALTAWWNDQAEIWLKTVVIDKLEYPRNGYLFNNLSEHKTL